MVRSENLCGQLHIWLEIENKKFYDLLSENISDDFKGKTKII